MCVFVKFCDELFPVGWNLAGVSKKLTGKDVSFEFPEFQL